METVTVSEILDLVRSISKNAQTAIHFLEGRILIGEINRPGDPTEKKARKKRTPKAKMDLKKEYQADRIGPPLQKPLNLPDADANNPFYTKKKREKKEVIE